MMKHCLNLILFLFLGLQLRAQVAPIAHYSFDACNVSDQTTNYADAIPFNSTSCECGVVGDAMVFGSGLDSLIFPLSMTPLFSSDFTLSFYISFDNYTDQMDILSVKNSTCQVDSSLSIKYAPATNQIDIEMGEDFNDIIMLSAALDQSLCWHHIVFAKLEREYFFYYNDELVDQVTGVQELFMEPTNQLAISNSACQGITDDPFLGRIDELYIFNQYLNIQEQGAYNIKPDLIISADTTLFLGDDLQIVTGPSCDPSPSWTPTQGVDMASDLEPLIEPMSSQVYTLTLDYNGCTTTDSIAINIIDPAALDCEQLLLPNAFTPNGDDLNDSYGISNSFIIEDLRFFRIYDRWGEIIYETADKNAQWDGTFKGKIVNPGMYLYMVEYDCQAASHVKSGNVSVLR